MIPMQSRLSLLLRLFGGLWLALGAVAADAGATAVRVGIYQNPPKLFVDDQGKPAGFFITLLEEIARRQGWQLSYRRCTWAACLNALDRGEIDLLPDLAWSPERAGRFGFGREVALSSWSVIYTPKGGALSTLQDLNHKKVAVVRGSIHYEALKKAARRLGLAIDFVETDRLDRAFALADDGAVDAALANTFYGWQNAARYDLVESLVVLQPTLLYFAASHDASERLLPAIDYYLTIWKQDKNSIYHQALARWITPLQKRFSLNSVLWGLVIGLTVIGLLLLVIALFRELVRRRTRELEEKKAHYDHLAHHDPLTGLPNRLLFFDRLEHSILQCQRQHCGLALLFLDLDQFKQINDSFGHAVGDQVLKEVARRLRDTVRRSDTVARIGGDEFAVIMEGLREPADVVTGIQHLFEAFGKPLEIPNHQFTITLSIGVSLFPQDGKDAQTLLRNADTAMFKAKAAGRNTYQLYDQAMTTETLERAMLEADLRSALEEDALEVHYQPQVALDDGRLVGLEALARWHHPEQGWIPPDRFIALAEDAGLIVPLGEKILIKACHQLSRWQEAGLAPGVLAVNFSTRQLLEPELLARISRALDASQCAPHWLEMEITENYLMQGTREALETLRRLRSMGVTLAMDDFGVGYSSLAYLKMLPLSKLKIDRSFVDGIPDDEHDRAITRAIIALGKALGLRVIAEGVETQAQADFLRQAGCDEGQGHLFGAPAPAEEIEALLRRQDSLKKA